MLSFARQRTSALTESLLVAVIVALPAGLTGMTAPTAAALQTSAAQQTLEGTLSIRHGDDFTRGKIAGYAYFLTSASGETQLAFEGAPPQDSVNGARVRVRGVQSGRQFLVAANGTQQISSSSISTSVSTGAKRVAIVLFNFSNDTSQPFTPAFAADLAFTNAMSVAAYYAENSWNQLTLSGDVLGWYTIPDTNANCAYSTWATSATTAASAAGVDLSVYDNVVYVSPTTSCGWAGLAEMPGRSSWLNGPGAMNLRVMAHELGHNFGTHHASNLNCTVGGVRVSLSANSADCNPGEYGDPFSVMGMSGQYQHTNFSRGNFRWLQAANTVTVTAGGDYTLNPIERYDPAAPQVLRIPRTSSTYLTLEYRQPYGSFDTFSTTAAVVNGVSIRIAPGDTTRLQSQLVDATPGTTSFLDASLLAGQTLSDPLSGVSMTTMSVSSAGAVVRVSFGSGPSPSPTPTASPTPTPTPSPDAQAPTAPTNLNAALGKGRRFTLSWGASTDNVGVTGYRVFRNDTLIATISGTTFSDTVTGNRSATYFVLAFDAAGNSSLASNAVSVAM